MKKYKLFSYKNGKLYHKQSGKRAGGKQGNYWFIWASSTNTREDKAVWEMHHGKLDDGLEIKHIDGDKLNSRIENLEVVRTRLKSPPKNAKPIPGMDGDYMACTDGSIYSRLSYKKKREATWKKLKPVDNGNGYWQMSFSLSSGEQTFLLHKLILLTFRGPKPKGMQCCHNDGDGKNNKLDNLRYDTPKNNNADKFSHRTAPLGQNHHSAKLKDTDIPKIFKLIKSMRQADIARKFGVKPTTIHRVLRRETFKHIPVQ